MCASSENKDPMRIGELAENGRLRKDLKLRVRVPSRLQEKLGVHVRGMYAGLKPKDKGTRVQLVFVIVDGERMTFRPQDLELA